MRTINGAELYEASDGELWALVNDDDLCATWDTRELAKGELYRRGQVRKVNSADVLDEILAREPVW